jgi:hypothetical protein
MRGYRIKILALLSLTILLGTTAVNNVSAIDDSNPVTYWYIGNNFDLIQEDDWVPFFSLVDVPYSLPLRGFISNTRNYFIDFGAVDWISDWVEYRYNWPVPYFERTLSSTEPVEQLEYLYEIMTSRLVRPISSVDAERSFTPLEYVKDFEAPFEAFIPLIVMHGLNESYDNAQMRDWVIHPSIVEDALNDAFPLVEWTTELYWFDYSNATEFADLMAEKTSASYVWIDYDFITRCDTILHDIISDHPKYPDVDLVLPTLIMLQEHTLLAATYDTPFAVGGLGRLNSSYPGIDSWNLNGRSLESYFFAGGPDNPRTSITPTVIHELGHCIGPTDVHALFSWFSAASSMSTMGAYQQPNCFDRFDMDLVNNGMALQLWGRYLDDLDYFRGFSLNSTQSAELDTIEESLTSIPALLIMYDMDTLRNLLYDVDATFVQLSNELGEPRKSSDWSDNTPILDVQIDWIIGPGIQNAEDIAMELESIIETNREIIPIENTTLPTPRYNVTIGVHSTADSYNEAMFQFWGHNMIEANTSAFDPEAVPEDAFTTWPRNKVFQSQSGYAIDGYVVEEWLTSTPYTLDVPESVQYRFYILNLENVTPLAQDPLDIMLILIALGCGGVTIIALIAIIRRQKT